MDQVKAELKGTRFPRTAEEGFRQCMALSTTALRWVRSSIRDNYPKASEEQLGQKMGTGWFSPGLEGLKKGEIGAAFNGHVR
jgi:hypothetical protein